MTIIQELRTLGQSIWLDNINRRMLENGELKQMIGLGLLGMTSNPSIFHQSIAESADYDQAILKLAKEGKTAFEIYDELTVKDVQDAADAFREVYDQTEGWDGYVSLEVNPHLAEDTDATVKEAERLFRKVNRPNVMFKIPSTAAGFPAVQTLLSKSINVNVTLIFSLDQYVQTAWAYIEGLRNLIKRGGEAAKVASVASVFVSRLDTLVDKRIEERVSKGGGGALTALKGKAAVANSRLIYQQYLQIFSQPQWQGLWRQGARPQRVLWGSTSTKNPAYRDIKYVEELIGKDTVNTVPQQTWKALLDHGQAKETLSLGREEARAAIEALNSQGINIDQACGELLKEGLAAFVKAFDALLAAIEKRRQNLS